MLQTKHHRLEAQDWRKRLLQAEDSVSRCTLGDRELISAHGQMAKLLVAGLASMDTTWSN